MGFKFFLCVLGMVLILEGLPYFAFPNKFKEMLKQVLDIPDSFLRMIGFLVMICGLLLVYWGRS